MPWGTTPATRVALRTTGWFGEVQPSAEQKHWQGWTGIKKVSVPLMAATASLAAPSATSSVRADLPTSGPPIPYPVPFPIGPFGSMYSTATLSPAVMGNGPFTVATPLFISVASLATPTVGTSYTVYVPAFGGLPVELPMVLGPQASLHAKAGMNGVGVGAVYVVNTPLVTATAAMTAPTATSGVTASAPLMTATAALAGGPQLSPPTAGAPRMIASAAMTAPLVRLDPNPVAAEPFAASATLNEPEVSVTTADATAEPPRMESTAALNTAVISSGATASAPAMEASGYNEPLPQALPFDIEVPVGFLTPTVTVGHTAAAPRMAATAGMATPVVSVGQTPAAPRMTASASMSAPTLVVGHTAAPPRMASSASMPTPNRLWTQPPVISPFTTSGTYSVPSWATTVEVILLGGGGGALNGAFTNGAGGKAGQWNAKTLVRDVDFSGAATISYTVGAGGTKGASAGSGGASSAAGASGAGGAGGSAFGAQNGKSPGNYSYNGQSYTGGATATSSTIQVPGTGGFGGGFFGSGSSDGGRGQVWFCARRD